MVITPYMCVIYLGCDSGNGNGMGRGHWKFLGMSFVSQSIEYMYTLR